MQKIIDNNKSFKVSFSGSILGFEELDEFELEIVKDTPFLYLRSLDNPEISFVTTSPFEWYNTYSIHLEEQLKTHLMIDDPEDVLVLSIVTIRDSLSTSTINLLAPLIINLNERIGTQQVLQGGIYRANHPLIVQKHKERGEE
ncbi:flagellar assembly protein FliW [Paenibacillus sp. JTLBN-2024]|uniref:Flagellar assembly factor FliW n=1 Tax=Paenibacillus cookii TaxID=157839 RepID=A0ABQ4LWB7_9BACL|nr:flagellar assembly protein FliW [Paenibacillus cookii]GIO67581.1 hypothetical protein J21TS3_24020 [Paenibacillus cookii]